MFTGFTEDTYRFFWELAFQNEKAFFDANRDRYRKNVYTPLRELTALLTPTVEEIDGGLCTRPSLVISHINRDTRFTKDKAPYRDHAWLGFRMGDTRISESFVLYAEFGREGYGYGMGMWGNQPELMQTIRRPILDKPDQFLALVGEKRFQGLFTLEGEAYKRPKFPDAPERIRPYVEQKHISFCYFSTDLKPTMRPEIADEVREAFLIMKPVYRFLKGLDA
jgi:uncharacterized protein (TIGR02453 family)